ncbi:phytoene/squalene synthase family protein [Saccharopolyspora sp. HNM0983]|uniref:Phytoene/squalene synthase family protein n=1 Tax=Saccharopolyspora montiporae TaxID=2781240 RepID=A0A929BCH1_9PSEU|nr:phytoene/squalene synthase family protein [Saccharopolyspora sp. HNM0983]MBE9376306.1 phytoene/squalene synthase family protein [Saccharopolyspora sp. HNM0983]
MDRGAEPVAPRRELDAAGIGDPRLRRSYRHCRQLHARHGRTYFLATRLLPAPRRPAVHALYGFARWIDDLVDAPDPRTRAEQPRTALRTAQQRLHAALRGDGAEDRHPVLAAVVDAVRRYSIEPALFDDFFRSMRMDLRPRTYRTRAELDDYVHGSAGVIGLQVLPVLGTRCPVERAAPYAAELGRAFQLTNFLRDVGEDLRRGRVYLPAEELAAFDVDRERLEGCLRTGRPDPAVRRALSDQVARARAVYRAAEPGIRLVDAGARPCVRTAHQLYGEILDRIVESGYAVFDQRVAVGPARRAGAAARAAGSVLATRWGTG